MNTSWGHSKSSMAVMGLLLFGFFYVPTLEAVQIGRLEIVPSLSLQGVYDDNALLRSEDDLEGPIQEDWSGSIRPSLEIAYDYGPTDISLAYHNEFLFFSEDKERNNYGRMHNLSLSGTHDFSEGASVSLEDSLRIGTEVSQLSEGGLDDVTQSGLLPGSREYVVNNISFGTTSTLSRRFTLNSSAAYVYSWYDDMERTGSADIAQTVDHLWSVQTTGSFSWHQRNSITATLGVTYNDYDERGKARIYLVTLGDSWQVISSVSLSGSVGMECLEQKDGLEEESSTYPYVALAATYTLRELNFSLAYSYNLQDSAGLGATNTANSVRFGLDYNPREDITVHAYGSYMKSDSAGEMAGQNLSVETGQGGGSIDYRFQPWAAITLQYNHIDQDATGVAGGSYKDNRVILGCTLSLPEGMI